MPKFRKKPVVIEAFQMTEERREDNSEWPNWLHEAWNKNPGDECALVTQSGNHACLAINTLEGQMAIDWDDFIIQGIKGELYPCKPDIFKTTYDAVS